MLLVPTYKLEGKLQMTFVKTSKIKLKKEKRAQRKGNQANSKTSLTHQWKNRAQVQTLQTLADLMKTAKIVVW